MDYLEKVQKSLQYIEDNLTNSISLDDLAGQAYFSTYYFHRLFQSIVGEPVMEYVRRKRLLYAADNLQYCDDNIHLSTNSTRRMFSPGHLNGYMV